MERWGACRMVSSNRSRAWQATRAHDFVSGGKGPGMVEVGGQRRTGRGGKGMNERENRLVGPTGIQIFQNNSNSFKHGSRKNQSS
jgi:hypothetical protein